MLWTQSAKTKPLLIAVAMVITGAIWWWFLASKNTEHAAQPQPKSQWFESSSTGELTQDMSYFAVSARTSPVLEMNYPYNEITASIGFGCDKTGEWMYVAFSEPPNIANTQTEDELHRFISRVSFDKDTEEYEVTQKFGERFIHFRDDARLLQSLVASTSMSFEVDWHREGPARFKFPLAGSAEMINKIQGKCAVFEAEKN